MPGRYLGVSISFLGMIQGFLFAFLFFKKRKNVNANLYLSLFMLIISVVVLCNGLVRIGFITSNPLLILAVCPDLSFSLMIFPALYIYAVNIYSEKTGLRNYSLKHLIPGIAAFFVLLYPAYEAYIASYQLVADGKKIHFMTLEFDHKYILIIILNLIHTVGIVYYIKIMILLRRKRSCAITKKQMMNLKWIKYSANIMFAAFLALMLNIVIIKLFNINMHLKIDPDNFFSGNIYSFVIVFLGYKVMFQPEIYYSADRLISGETGKIDKYSHIKISKEKADLIIARLEKLMSVDKIYTDSELTMEMMSEYLSVNKNVLSFLLNSIIKKKFIEYVNEHRVRSIIEIFREDSGINLLNAAYKVGFNSKASFNRAFKKHTGMTPTEFIKKISSRELT